MENNKELGPINEKELEEITSNAADAAGGTLKNITLAICPTGACTNY